MRKCKLSECVKEINDRTTENNQYEVLTSSKNGIFSQEEYFDKQVASKDNTGYKIIKNGQFTYRSMSDSGTFTINRLEDKEIGIVSPAYPVFEATNIDAEFLKYYFKSELFSKAIINLSQGSTRTALKFKDLINIEIYLPEIEEQRRIVKILKNNDQVIEKYDELIREKEQFIKSQFVEMFGRYKNEKKYKLKELSKFVTVGIANSATQDYTTDGIVMLRNQNIKENYLDDNDLIYINKDFSEKYKNKKLMKNDILVTRTGYPGIACIVPKKYENCQTFTTLIIRLKDDNDINANYVCHYINSIYGKRYVKDNQVGVAQQNFGATALGEMPIFIPSLYEQNVFIQIVQLIDKQKFELEKQKQNYIDLKKGLMQQLLTGKLKV